MPQLAGEDILASDIKTPLFVKKAGAQSVTSSTTLVNDADINAIALEANKIYFCQFRASASGATGGDIKITWVVTGGAAELCSRTEYGPAIGVADVTDTNVRIARNVLASVVPYGTETNAASIMEDFMVQTTTAGTLTLQWAQNASSGTATQLSASTYLMLTEVEEF